LCVTVCGPAGRSRLPSSPDSSGRIEVPAVFSPSPFSFFIFPFSFLCADQWPGKLNGLSVELLNGVFGASSVCFGGWIKLRVGGKGLREQNSADLKAILVVCYNDLPPVAPLKGGRFDCGGWRPFPPLLFPFSFFLFHSSVQISGRGS